MAGMLKAVVGPLGMHLVQHEVVTTTQDEQVYDLNGTGPQGGV